METTPLEFQSEALRIGENFLCKHHHLCPFLVRLPFQLQDVHDEMFCSPVDGWMQFMQSQLVLQHIFLLIVDWILFVIKSLINHHAKAGIAQLGLTHEHMQVSLGDINPVFTLPTIDHKDHAMDLDGTIEKLPNVPHGFSARHFPNARGEEAIEFLVVITRVFNLSIFVGSSHPLHVILDVLPTRTDFQPVQQGSFARLVETNDQKLWELAAPTDDATRESSTL